MSKLYVSHDRVFKRIQKMLTVKTSFFTFLKSLDLVTYALLQQVIQLSTLSFSPLMTDHIETCSKSQLIIWSMTVLMSPGSYNKCSRESSDYIMVHRTMQLGKLAVHKLKRMGSKQLPCGTHVSSKLILHHLH